MHKRLLALACALSLACSDGTEPPVPTKLGVHQQPVAATAGAAFSPVLVIAIQDASGNTVTSSTASVTVAITTNPASGTLSGTTTVAAVNGIATFSGLSIDKAGAGYAITATSTGLTSATATAFDVAAGAPSQLAITAQPTSATAGVAIAPAITVAIRDALGNTTTSTGAVTIAIGSNANNGTLSGTRTVSAVNGVATFSNLSIEKAGAGYTLDVSFTGLTSVISSSFSITPAVAAKLAFDTQPGDVGVTQTNAPALNVSIRDAFDNVVTSATNGVTVALSTNAVGALAYGTTTVNAVAGVASFVGVRVHRPGTFTLAATSGTLTGATSGSFTTSITFDRVAMDTAKTCATSTPQGVMYCWGNVFGPDGVGVIATVPTPVPGDATVPASHSSLVFTSVADGTGHSCGLTSAGAAYCWGGGALGGLGNGTNGTSGVPVAVSGGLTFNSGALASGWYHNCGVTTTRAMYCWGYNANSQLGDGTTTDRNAPVQIGAGTEWLLPAGGRYHSCAITFAALTVQCWGNNTHGQLGDGTTTQRATPTAESSGLGFTRIGAGGTANTGHTCGLAVGGAAYCWGNNQFGQIGDGTTTSPRLTATAVSMPAGLTFTRIAVGSRHACALTSAGAAYCWGANTNGQLGDGTTAQRSVPTLVSGSHAFSSIAAGDLHTCGVRTDAKILCWGFNGAGQLGDGTTTERLVPTLAKQ